MSRELLGELPLRKVAEMDQHKQCRRSVNGMVGPFHVLDVPWQSWNMRDSHFVPGSEPTRLRPTPGEILDLVLQIVASPWPPDQAALTARLEHLELDMIRAPQEWGRLMPDAKGPHEVKSESSGTHWFLWPDNPVDDLESAVATLRAGFTTAFGAPLDQSHYPDGGFTGAWSNDGRLVELYLHTGRSANRHDAPVVQLSVTRPSADIPPSGVQQSGVRVRR